MKQPAMVIGFQVKCQIPMGDQEKYTKNSVITEYGRWEELGSQEQILPSHMQRKTTFPQKH